MTVGTCPGCGYTPATGKTRDLNKHMDLTRNRPCEALLKLSQQKKTWENPNARKPNESIRQWGSRLRKRYNEVGGVDKGQPQNLHECQLMYHDLLQIDPEACPPQSDEEHENNEAVAALQNTLISE